jgi:hypothetical protein
MWVLGREGSEAGVVKNRNHGASQANELGDRHEPMCSTNVWIPLHMAETAGTCHVSAFQTLCWEFRHSLHFIVQRLILACSPVALDSSIHHHLGQITALPRSI